MCLAAVCPLGWLWAREMGLVSLAAPPSWAHCCLWLQLTGTVPHRPALAGVSGTPVMPASKEFQCFPGLCLHQCPSPVTRGIPSAQILHSLSPCVAALPGAGHPGSPGHTSDPTALSRRLIILCHKQAQVQSVFESEQSLLSLPYSYPSKPQIVMLSLQSRGTAWRLLFPFDLKQ